MEGVENPAFVATGETNAELPSNGGENPAFVARTTTRAVFSMPVGLSAAQIAPAGHGRSWFTYAEALEALAAAE